MVVDVMGLDEVAKEMKVQAGKRRAKILEHSSVKKLGRGGGTGKGD